MAQTAEQVYEILAPGGRYHHFPTRWMNEIKSRSGLGMTRRDLFFYRAYMVRVAAFHRRAATFPGFEQLIRDLRGDPTFDVTQWLSDKYTAYEDMTAAMDTALALSRDLDAADVTPLVTRTDGVIARIAD